MQQSVALFNSTRMTSLRNSIRVRAGWLLMLLMVGVGTAVVAPFYFSRYYMAPDGHRVMVVPGTHDMAQHLAVMEQFDKVLGSGTLYPRWLPDVNNGYGLAWTNFYSPAFYYPAALVTALVQDRYRSLFVLSVLSLVASGLAFYLMAKQFYGRAASATAALLYMLLPYHTLDQYWRGAFPELQGFILVPLILYFAYRAGSRGRLSDYAGLGLCQGLHYVTHFPVAYLMTYTVALYALVWAVRKSDWRILLRIGVGLSLAFLFSAIYWLPAVFESKYAQEHFTSIFPYHNGYITLLPGGDRFSELINQSFAVQSLALLAAIAVLRLTNGAAAPSLDKAEEVRQGQTRMLVILGLATTFMVTSLSIYLSKLIPKIEAVSFPMRWMVITSFFTAIVVGAAVDRLRRPGRLHPAALWACRLAIGAVLATNLWITVDHILLEALSNSALAPPPIHYESAFVPKGGREPRNLPDTPNVVIEPAAGKAEVVRWEPNHREIALSVQEPSTVRLKTYNFPGWSARLDGQKVAITSDLDGVQTIAVPPGQHGLEVSFRQTLPRTIGTILSAMSVLAMIGLTIAQRRQTWGTNTKREDVVAEPISLDTASRETVNEAEIRAEESDSQYADGRSSRKQKRGRLVSIGLLVLVAVVALLVMSRFLGSGARPTETAPATPTRSGIVPGGEITLQVPGLPSIMVAADESALIELTGALAAGDQNKVESLIESQAVHRVPNGTKVRVLEAATGKVKVRILEGNSVLKEGWVSERWIHSSNR